MTTIQQTQRAADLANLHDDLLAQSGPLAEITVTEIEALESEAKAAGDGDLAALCGRALYCDKATAQVATILARRACDGQVDR